MVRLSERPEPLCLMAAGSRGLPDRQSIVLSASPLKTREQQPVHEPDASKGSAAMYQTRFPQLQGDTVPKSKSPSIGDGLRDALNLRDDRA